MKRLLSSLLAVIMIMNTCQLCLKNCIAMDQNEFYGFDGYEIVGDDCCKNNRDNGKSKSAKLVVPDGCTCKFNKAKDEIKVEYQKPNFLLTLVRKAFEVYLCGIGVKLLSDGFPEVNKFFNSNADFIRKSFNFVKQKFDDTEWMKAIKENFMSTTFYDYMFGPSTQGDAGPNKESDLPQAAGPCNSKI